MGWSPTHVRDAQWKVVYANKQSLALEQDHAAGGRDNRVMQDSGALARVVLQARNRRLYAELRWQIDKKQHSRYLGEVTAANRAANLAAGWQLAHDRGLTTTSDTGNKDRAITV
jgi:hypothetical protein